MSSDRQKSSESDVSQKQPLWSLTFRSRKSLDSSLTFSNPQLSKLRTSSTDISSIPYGSQEALIDIDSKSRSKSGNSLFSTFRKKKQSGSRGSILSDPDLFKDPLETSRGSIGTLFMNTISEGAQNDSVNSLSSLSLAQSPESMDNLSSSLSTSTSQLIKKEETPEVESIFTKPQVKSASVKEEEENDDDLDEILTEGKVKARMTFLEFLSLEPPPELPISSSTANEEELKKEDLPKKAVEISDLIFSTELKSNVTGLWKAYSCSISTKVVSFYKDKDDMVISL
jgi:hypothetical protein